MSSVGNGGWEVAVGSGTTGEVCVVSGKIVGVGKLGVAVASPRTAVQEIIKMEMTESRSQYVFMDFKLTQTSDELSLVVLN
jgi:hypothetical protein